MTPPLGTLHLTVQVVETGFGHYRQIVDAKLEGVPVVRIGDSEVNTLPEWAIALDGELVQFGEYVFRTTGIRDFATRSTYYYRVDDGLPYWLWWRMCQVLEGIGARIVLTLAVWGLGAWPREGSVPSWSDVVRRWKQ